MKKALTIGLAAAAMIAGAVSLVKVDNSAQAPAAIITEAAAAESEAPPTVLRNAHVNLAQLAPSQLYRLDYERGPRIIHVPQSEERRPPVARASVQRRPEPAVVEDDDDEYVSPPPRPRVVAPKPRVAAPSSDRTPRWKLRTETPASPSPPPGPRRAVLSAPPLGADGPTPLRPTPRFDNKAADAGEKFASPRAPAAAAPVVSETQPPLGYSPPVTPAPEAAPVEEMSAVPTAPLPED